MATTIKQRSDVISMIDCYVNCYRMNKGRSPVEVALTSKQAGHLGVENGGVFKGMKVVIFK